MDGISAELHLEYSGAPPVLIAGSNESAIERAKNTVAGCGYRIGAAVNIADAPARWKIQGRASAAWVELDGSPPDDTHDEFVRCLNADVRARRYPAVISAPKELIDPLVSVLEDDVQLLIDANTAERASALAIALATNLSDEAARDIASDSSSERLRQLSEEVSRIASTLARLSTGPAVSASVIEVSPNADAPPVSAETVRTVIRARRLRARFFSEELFADPAWDMLLDLLQAEISHLRVPVSSLCIAAAVPATTALRWLKTMVNQGIFVRRADPHDGRRVFVELSPDASSALRRYFAEVARGAVT